MALPQGYVPYHLPAAKVKSSNIGSIGLYMCGCPHIKGNNQGSRAKKATCHKQPLAGRYGGSLWQVNRQFYAAFGHRDGPSSCASEQQGTGLVPMAACNGLSAPHVQITSRLYYRSTACLLLTKKNAKPEAQVQTFASMAG